MDAELPARPAAVAPLLSVVVPLYNEEESIGPLYWAIVSALEAARVRFEIVCIDDGSSDQTFARAKAIAQHDPRLRIVKFRRNYGQTPAMVAGIEHARGRVLVTMDGDLQNDPRDIPAFLDKLEEGYDLVVGWRHQRQDKFLTRKLPSRIANRLIGAVTGVPIKDNGCSLKAYRAEVIKRVPLYSEMHRFIPAMASITGARVAEIRVRHHPRRFGVSKYGLSRTYKVLIDLLTIKTLISSASRPLSWFGLLALPAAAAGMGALGFTALSLLGGGSISLPIAGSGILFSALALVLLGCGAIAELVYLTGDLQVPRLARLTAVVTSEHAAPEAAALQGGSSYA